MVVLKKAVDKRIADIGHDDGVGPAPVTGELVPADDRLDGAGKTTVSDSGLRSTGTIIPLSSASSRSLLDRHPAISAVKPATPCFITRFQIANTA